MKAEDEAEEGERNGVSEGSGHRLAVPGPEDAAKSGRSVGKCGQTERRNVRGLCLEAILFILATP